MTHDIYYQYAHIRSWNAVDYTHMLDERFSQIYNGFYVQPYDVAMLGNPAWVTTKHYWQNSSGADITTYTSVDTLGSNGVASTVGCWSGGPCLPFTYKIYDDDYFGLPADFIQVQYTGNWTNSDGWSRAYYSGVHYSNTINDIHKLSAFPGSGGPLGFYGGSITRVYAMAYNRGLATVTIDGTAYVMSDYAPTTRWQAAKTWSLSPGLHTIEARVSGGGYIDLDFFVIDISAYASGSYEDSLTGILKYIPTGNWTHSTNWPSASGGTVSWTSTPEDAVTFAFTGNQITYYYTKAYNRGKAAITIDGVDKGYVDLYSSATLWQQSTTFTNLGSGIHTIHISHSGQPNACTGTCYIDVDKLVVP